MIHAKDGQFFCIIPAPGKRLGAEYGQFLFNNEVLKNLYSI